MTTPCPVDGCETRVFEALLPAGSTIRLNALPARKGTIAAAKDGSGQWRARLLRSGEIPGEGEQRFNPHRCAGRGGGLAELSSAQSRHARRARTERGRPRRNGSSPFGRASGIRVPPPGGDAA